MPTLPNDRSGRKSCYFCFIFIIVVIFYYLDYYTILTFISALLVSSPILTKEDVSLED